MKASELKKGDVVEINGQLYLTKQIDVKSPSSRGANTLYKVRFSQVQTKQKFEQSYKGDDQLTRAELLRCKLHYSYLDGDNVVLMDAEDYSQHSVPLSELEEERYYLSEGMEDIIGLLVNEQLIGIELPQSVVMEIIDTAPAIKGATASGRTKPATFSTGLVVQVPEYLTTGEKVKINTHENRFMSRA
jgi:elongation factor P